MIPIVLVGAAGRMGRAVTEALVELDGMTLKARIEKEGVAAPAGGGALWGHDLAAVVAEDDVVVEFTNPGVAARTAELCAERGASLVSGTTGLGEAEEKRVRAAARRIGIVRAANFSLGVLALRRSLASALGALPAGWDIEIVERHHRGKLDAPSGTALHLAQEVAERRGYPPGALRNGRSGRTGPRPGPEIGIHALRGGTWVGDHAVILSGTGEWLELRHVAENRSAFAQGVLAAARFVHTASPGFYTLDEVASAAAR